MPPSALTAPVSKRKRDGERKTCWVRCLMCIPSISEKIARKLLDEYGSLPEIQRALQNTATFRRIRLDDRCCIGKARIKKLALYLTDAECSQTSPEEPRVGN